MVRVTKTACLLLRSKTQVPKIERAYLQRIVQVDIDGAVNVTPGNPIDVIIAVSVSGVLSRASLLFRSNTLPKRTQLIG